MNAPSPELHDLIELACENRLTADDVSRLEVLLLDHPAEQQYYLDCLQAQASLERSCTKSDEPVGHTALDLAPRPKSLMQWASRHPRVPAFAVTVAIFLAVLLTMAATPVSQWIAGNGGNIEQDTKPAAEAEHVAILNNWQNAKWLGDSRPPLNNPRLNIGTRLVLASGKIEVKYLTGARVVIEGPAEFVVGGQASGDQAVRSQEKKANSGYLAVGSLVARVEGEEAQGFTIDTPNARVEDFGTEFGVEVLGSGVAEVVVLSGEVDVVRDDGDGSEHRLRLAKEEGASVTSSGVISRRESISVGVLTAMRAQLDTIRDEPEVTANVTGETVTITAPSTPPAVDGADIAMLEQGDILTKGRPSIMWTDRPAGGQTFTTGDHAAGYTLDAITLRLSGASSGETWQVRVGTISDKFFRPFAIGSATNTYTTSGDHYITFSFSPVGLNPNTQYAFDVRVTAATGGDYRSLLNGNVSDYAGGSAYTTWVGGTRDATVTFYEHDRVFHLNLMAVTEPDSEEDEIGETTRESKESRVDKIEKADKQTLD